MKMQNKLHYKNQSINYVKNHNTMYNMQKMSQGGMFIPSQDSSKSYKTVLEYLANSKITRLTKGTYGITYIAELHESSVIRHPFLKLTVGKLYKTPVKKLLVKVCVIEDPNIEESAYPRKDTTWNVAQQMNIEPLPIDEITEEINIQTDIYLKTMQNLQPICPGIVYSSFIDRSDNGPLNYFQDIPKNNADPRTDDSHISKVGFGIIVMELASDYVTMFDYKRSNNPNDAADFFDAKLKCLFALIQLALDTGYTHGDHHFANIMYNKKDSKYFHGTRGRILLIDFGRSTKIPSSDMKTFKSMCDSKQYLQALEILCLPPVANDYIADPRYAEKYYGWACCSYGGLLKTNERYVAIINESIEKLFELREEQLNMNAEIMEKLHAKKNMYPLLPLSNRLKNQLYNGILPADKPKNKTMRTKMRSTKTKTKRFHTPTSKTSSLSFKTPISGRNSKTKHSSNRSTRIQRSA